MLMYLVSALAPSMLNSANCSWEKSIKFWMLKKGTEHESIFWFMIIVFLGLCILLVDFYPIFDLARTLGVGVMLSVLSSSCNLFSVFEVHQCRWNARQRFNSSMLKHAEHARAHIARMGLLPHGSAVYLGSSIVIEWLFSDFFHTS